ncbi:MAG: hypothetical protein FWC32_07560 [Firmicutes bacterium]|nr:hypothetical protein [Bacillota bacterium]
MTKHKSALHVALYSILGKDTDYSNVLEVYFSFLATIISEEDWDDISEDIVAQKLDSKYGLALPSSVIRQILGVGMSNNSIVYTKGKYVVNRDILNNYCIDEESAQTFWPRLINEFINYCSRYRQPNITEAAAEKQIDDFFQNSNSVYRNIEHAADKHSDNLSFLWSRFLQVTSEENETLFNAVAMFRYANTIKEALFCTIEGTDIYKGLNVYLDSPMIFALLGMDEKPRNESCQMLLDEIKKAGCSVYIFDHCYDEVDGILQRAYGWATHPEYDISKANKVAKYFRDRNMQGIEISDYCSALENELKNHEILKRETEYDVTEHTFQEDEAQLENMIVEQYRNNGYFVENEKKDSIRHDVRSIIMVYRLRKGAKSTTIHDSKDIMLTLNGAIANVCKKYESNKSISSGHVPACISADLFGTILWLFKPSLIEYHKKQLLADCYAIVKPSKKLLREFVASVDAAKNLNQLDEKQWLLLRSHSVVSDTLMNITHGDYARFNERTCFEVYEEIVSSAKAAGEQKYSAEQQSHFETKSMLQQKSTELSTAQNELIESQEAMKGHEERWEKTIKALGAFINIVLFGVIWILLLGGIRLLGQRIATSTIISVFVLGVLTLVPSWVSKFFKKITRQFSDWVAKKIITRISG